VLAMHTDRQSFVKARTAQANQIRGLLVEFRFIVPQGIRHIYERVPIWWKKQAMNCPAASGCSSIDCCST
jgi:hypothetical protein